MRDPSRISIFCIEFAVFWQRFCPDLRFWQVIGVVAEYFDNSYFRRDPFYAEEKDWQNALKAATATFEKEKYK